VSLDGGFRHRSVLGGAFREKEPIHGGIIVVEGKFKGVKEEEAGGISDDFRDKKDWRIGKNAPWVPKVCNGVSLVRYLWRELIEPC
jgi:hypothetical protein